MQVSRHVNADRLYRYHLCSAALACTLPAHSRRDVLTLHWPNLTRAQDAAELELIRTLIVTPVEWHNNQAGEAEKVDNLIDCQMAAADDALFLQPPAVAAVVQA